MHFLRHAAHRAAVWTADRLRVRRLWTATTYLLVRQLNSNPPPEGPESNRRLQNAFLHLFETLKPDVFFDIGANDGSASLSVRRTAPNCTVHAFEANPQIYARHQARLEQQGVRYWNLAVADEAGSTVVYAPRTLSRAYVNGEVVPASITEAEGTGKTSLLRRNEDATYAEFSVEATTLDAFVEAHVKDWRDRTAFLWIDVEGAADRVLAGATRLLSRTRVVLIETENFAFWQDQANCGTVVTRLIALGFVPVARDREYGDKQFNVLLVHQDAIGQILPELFDKQAPLRRASDAETKGDETPQTAEITIPSRCTSIGAARQREIPIFIPCFNAVTYVRGMVEQLRERGLQRIVLVDNASTYPPMRDYLAAPGHGVTVVALTANKGPRDIFLDPANFALLPQFFCVTDPDLILNPAMPDDFLAQLAALTETLSLGKAGLALDITDRDAMRQDEFLISDRRWKIWEWEEQFWQQELEPLPGGDPVFKASIDTSFALYNKRFFKVTEHLEAVRVGGRYTCRHLPWYNDTGLPADEEHFYRTHAQDSFYMRSPAAPDEKPRYERDA